MKVLIAGAGLGGLTAAIALRQRGIDVEVFEAASEIERTGAGLTLGLGAQHVFRALGLQQAVAGKACPAGALPFLHYKTGDVLLGALDPGDGLPDDGKANIVRHIYRADLQDILVEECIQLGGRLHTGSAVVDVGEDREGASITLADGTTHSGDLVVGADGVRSRLRSQLFPGDKPRFTNHVAYRFLIPKHDARPFMGKGRSAIFIGPGRTFNRYSMAGGTIINGAALAETSEEISEGWSTKASQAELEAAFADWHEDVSGLISKAGSIIKWGLYDRKPLATWHQGRAVLIGDAAHAMLPFLGMGAAMAIEDGYVLARSLADEASIDAALVKLEALRIPRTTEVHIASKRQGEVTQSIDPDNFALAGAPINNREMMEFDPTV